LTMSHDEAASDLREQASEEIEFERDLLQRLTARQRGTLLSNILVIVLIGLMIAAILVQPYVFLLWIFVGFLIYSYNFIIILIPTTTTRIRPGEQSVLKNTDKEARWLAIRLLLKNKRLAVEVGLTVFLGGMIPLVLSFAVIFGITAVFAVYYGFVVGFITIHTATTVLIQIGFVFLLYSVIYLLEPMSQGRSRLAALYAGRGHTRRTARTVATVVLAIVVLLGLLTSLLGLWALLLPAVTMQALIEAYELLDRFDLFLFVVVLAAQLMVMRYIQGFASRRMAVNRINMRILTISNIVASLDRIGDQENMEEELRSLRRQFYNIAIYDIVEHDIYGNLPVYLIGPRLRYLLDSKVLKELE